LYFGEDESLVAEVIDNTTSRGRTLRFLFDGPYDEFRNKLQELGETPLPKYIDRPVEPQDKERFQTIYAKNEGAVAAPTAGLHFSKHLLKKLEIKGVLLPEITLHIGLGTFSPVDVEDLSKHKMDSEELIIKQESADIINNALRNNKKICAVGTTVMRGLESSVSSHGTLNPYNGWTHKFIYPPFDFSIANSMISNFHTPKSTLLMMVSAFGDKDFIMKAYKEAMKKKYKFSSYGDAMMII
jgi:S-adenosylmethionine:tRNA ribosyltransferase-isomerase